jgi:hypothetical protein
VVDLVAVAEEFGDEGRGELRHQLLEARNS